MFALRECLILGGSICQSPLVYSLNISNTRSSRGFSKHWWLSHHHWGFFFWLFWGLRLGVGWCWRCRVCSRASQIPSLSLESSWTMPGCTHSGFCRIYPHFQLGKSPKGSSSSARRFFGGNAAFRAGLGWAGVRVLGDSPRLEVGLLHTPLLLWGWELWKDGNQATVLVRG